MCLNTDKMIWIFLRPLYSNLNYKVVKKSLLFGILLLNVNILSAIQLDDFLKKNISNGLVNYSSIKNTQSNELDSLIENFNNRITQNPQKADYINLYNLHVIKQVIQHYPITSPTSVTGFFEATKIKVGNKEITLNELENKIIRPTYNDPRVHFALVCGAKGCPPIQNFAFNQDKIESQLDSVTSWALNNSGFIKSDSLGNAKISEIFKWYIEDFGGNEKKIKAFINQYRKKKIKSICYYPYDWTLNDLKNVSNVATYTPSVLLKHKQFELQMFNNLYTQKGGFNENGKNIIGNSRQTWNTTMMTFNYGISKSGRFNLGLDVNLRSVRYDDKNSFAANIFRYAQDENNRTTISTIGPKIKWNPIKSIPKFSVQSTFWIPVAKELQGTPWLDWQRYTSWTQLFYDKTFGSKYQLFTELAAWVRIPEYGSGEGINNTSVETPISVFFSYFPNSKSTIYTQLQYWPVISSLPNYFSQAGIGGKYQILPQLQIETSYTNFFAGLNQGSGATFNFGLRFISK